MNKFTKIFSIALVFCAFAIGLVACNGELKSFSIKEGTLANEILKGGVLDTERVVLVLEYENGAKEEKFADDTVTYSQIDTNELGMQTLVITYAGLTYTMDIEVVEEYSSNYEVLGFSKPLFAIQHSDNKVVKVDDVSTSEDESEYSFKKNSEKYVVGSDNDFVFMPKVTALDSTNQVVDLNTCPLDITVQIKVENDFVDIAEDDLADYVDINYHTGSFDFTNLAEGKEFKIFVMPREWDDEDDAISFEFIVKKGYNIHRVQELSVLNNISSSQVSNLVAKEVLDGWDEYKSANYIEQPQNLTAVMIHGNFNITDNDVSQGLFLNDGSMVDWQSIYSINIPQNTSNTGYDFTIHGNYFQINASELSLTNVNASEGEISHSALFGFGGDNHNTTSDAKQGKISVQNLQLKGNAQKSEQGSYAGGFAMVNTSMQETNFDNVICTGFSTHITAMHNEGDYTNELKLESCKLYDSYSVAVYLWALKNATINNSVLKRAGGPLIMAVHTYPDEAGYEEAYSNVVLQNTIAESWITGNEAWFVNYNASATVGMWKALNQIFTGTGAALMGQEVLTTGKTFVDYSTKPEGLINLIGVVMADDPLQMETAVKGSITVKNAEGVITHKLDNGEQTLMGSINTIVSAIGNAAKQLPFFQSSTQSVADTMTYVTINTSQNGFAKLSTTGLIDWVSNSTLEEIEDFYSGDLLSCYLNGGGLGALVEYLDVENS